MKYETLYKAFFKYSDSGDKIYRQRIANENTIHLDFTIADYHAFVCGNFEMMHLIEHIYELNGKIISLVKSIDISKAFSNWMKFNTLVEEIVITNNIEGVISTRKEIGQLTQIERPQKYIRFYGLVNKYRKILNGNEFKPIKDSRDVRFLFDDIMLQDIKENDPKSIPDGRLFRKEPVEVRSQTKAFHTGLMPEDEIIRKMDEALDFLNNKEVPLLVRVAIFHYLFGYIHPFYDGNGRMDRYISSYYLASSLDEYVALQLSVACKKNQKKYYDGFKITNDPRNRGDLTYFVLNFLEIILDGLESFKEKASNQKNRYLHYKIAIGEIGIMGTEKDVLEAVMGSSLFDAPTCTISDISSQINRSTKTVSAYLNKLADKHLILCESHHHEKSFKFNDLYIDHIFANEKD